MFTTKFPTKKRPYPVLQGIGRRNLLLSKLQKDWYIRLVGLYLNSDINYFSVTYANLLNRNPHYIPEK